MSGTVALNRCAEHHAHPASQGHELVSHHYYAGQSWHYDESTGQLHLNPSRELCLTARENYAGFHPDVHLCRVIEKEIPDGWSVEALDK